MTDANPHQDEDTLRYLYQEKGYTQEEIGDLLGRHHSTIKYWMDKLDVDARTPISERPPKVGVDTAGRERFASRCGGKQDLVLHHRLLMCVEHDISEFEGKIVHHKNGISWDNRLENLEFTTRPEHQRHHRAAGDMDMTAKLSESEVLEIYRKHDENSNYKQLGERYGVTADTIKNVIMGDSWAWLTESESPETHLIK